MNWKKKNQKNPRCTRSQKTHDLVLVLSFTLSDRRQDVPLSGPQASHLGSKDNHHRDREGHECHRVWPHTENSECRSACQARLQETSERLVSRHLPWIPSLCPSCPLHLWSSLFPILQTLLDLLYCLRAFTDILPQYKNAPCPPETHLLRSWGHHPRALRGGASARPATAALGMLFIRLFTCCLAWN